MENVCSTCQERLWVCSDMDGLQEKCKALGRFHCVGGSVWVSMADEGDSTPPPRFSSLRDVGADSKDHHC